MKSLLSLLLVAMLLTLAVTVGAYPSLFDARCSGCHSDDNATCNGCHFHRGSLNAVAGADAYAPGDPLSVTLTGGSQSGWIRALLYDEAGLVQALVAGPSGTGDDGAGDPVTFPVVLEATAPLATGDYTWEAAWFGGNTSGSGHSEVRTPVTILVDDTNTSIPEMAGAEHLASLSAIKALY
jgi:hypothetical protein